MHATMAKYFGDWRPACTTVCINQLSSPGARIELDMIVALPKKAVMTLPPHLARIVEADYPRFSDAEMARRRAAIEALLAEHDCDHLIFCGANRFGSAVQWLTQWPVTAEAVGVFTPGERDALFVQYVNHAPQARVSPTRPTSPGAANPRSPPRSTCWNSAAAQRPHRLHRAADRRAARAAFRAFPTHRQSQPRLYAAAPGQIGGGARLAAHRRAFHDLGMPALRDGLRAGLDRARTRRPCRARLCVARRRPTSSTSSASRRWPRPTRRAARSLPTTRRVQPATSCWPRSARRSGIIPARCCAASRSGEPTQLYRDLHAAADAAFDAIAAVLKAGATPARGHRSLRRDRGGRLHHH